MNATRKHVNSEPPDDHYDVIEYALVVCGRCESVSLVESKYLEVPGEFSAPQGEQILYPTNQQISTDELPENIARPYLDAARSFRVGLYEPCVIMCRKCLEAVCHQLGIVNGNLKRRLETLQKNGQIDLKLLTWANELRLIGNDAAHDLDIRIQQNDARDAFEFLEAILMYTFLLNERFENFKARRTEDQHTKT